MHQPQGVYSVFVLWPAFKGLIRSIRLIRGRKESLSSGVLPFRQRFLVELYPRALPPVTHGSALQAPERLWGTCDVITLQAQECILGSGDVRVLPH